MVGGVGYLKSTKRFRFPFVKEIFDLHGNNLVNSRLNLKNDLLDFVYFYCGGFCPVILFLFIVFMWNWMVKPDPNIFTAYILANSAKIQF